MIVSSSGYYATGSSAVYDLLKEYENNTTGIIGNKEYEHVLFYTPGGLFDVEDKLLYGNSIHRSDEAIKTFVAEMERLYHYNYGWFGSYKVLVGDDFRKNNQNLVDSLVQYRVDAHWSYHIRKIGFSFRKIKNSIKDVLKGKPVRGRFWEGYFYDGNKEILYAFPTRDEFNIIARKYVYNYFACIQKGFDCKNLVLNHVVLPQNAGRLFSYGVKDFFTIIVDRDPRDVYAYIKYVGTARDVKSRIPIEVNDFIAFWKAMRKNDIFAYPNILKVQFEDLIYRYDESVKQIEQFLGIEEKEHTKKYVFFDPSVSIKNTQIYQRVGMKKEELDLIEKELHEYLYDFLEIEFSESISIEVLGNVHLQKRKF